MSHISEDKLRIVRGLIDQAPDSVVRTLMAALSDGELDPGLRSVKNILEAEATDRRARNTVLAPIAPLCSGKPGFTRVALAPRVLALLWRGLKAIRPAETERAVALVADWRPDAQTDGFDVLCFAAAAGLRDAEDPHFAAAAAAAGDNAETLARCLDLAAVTRRALERMPEWIGRMTDEKTAHLRLAYRDVVAVAEDGGPRFFEMLAAPLVEPWLILRVISGAMHHPTEAYLAASELASFGERVMDDVDARLAMIAAFDRNAPDGAAAAASQAAHLATTQIAELETCVQLTPDGPWGKRVASQKRMLAQSVEHRLKDVDDAVAQALPLQTLRLGPRTKRGVPKLTANPDAVQVRRASTLLTFLDAVQCSAQAGGFASARAKAVEVLEARLDHYVEDILESLRHGEIEDEARARAYLEIAARFCGLASGDKAAQLVRRRAAAA